MVILLMLIRCLIAYLSIGVLHTLYAIGETDYKCRYKRKLITILKSGLSTYGQ